MSCEVTRGRRIPCKDGAAGLLAVYFLNRTPEFTVSFDGTLVDDITITDGGGAVTLYKYELDNVGNNLEETLEASRDNGTYFSNQVLTLALQTLQDDDLADIQNLAKGRPAVLVQYRNGKVRLAGIERGMDTTGNNASGGDLGDFQGYNLTMTAKENDYAPLLKGYTLANPFAGLTTAPTVVTGDPES
jgi:hypothetical protein